MKQQILHLMKISITVVLVLFSLLFTVLLIVYLFTEFTIDDPANYELVPFFIGLFIIVSTVIYHAKTFYLISKVPRGESFHFKKVKKELWYCPWALSGLIYWALLMILIDEISIGISFDFIDWLFFGFLFFIATISAIEVWSLKKIYTTKSINYSNIIEEIGEH